MTFKQTTIIQLLFLVFFGMSTIQAEKSIDQIFTKSTTQVISLNNKNLSAKSTQLYQHIDLGEYGEYKLYLEQTYMFSDDYLARRAKKDKEHMKLPLTFRGTVQGQPNTLVSLTTNEDFLSGFIDTGEEVIYFEPYIIDQGHACASNHTALQTKQINSSNSSFKSAATGCYVVEMVLAADYGMYKKHRSNTLTHITSVLNKVKTNYDNEFNNSITFDVVDDYIATNPGMDLWSGTNNGNDLIEEFLSSDISDKGYDLASLWVTRSNLKAKDENGNFVEIAGIAYSSAVCESFRYNIINDFGMSGNHLRVAFAHEIGHNFGANHDSAGSGTIMAPAVNSSNTWSAKSKNEINAFYPNAGCLCTADATVTYGCKIANAHNYNPNATHADNTICETCSDRIQNGNETSVDCGGRCPSCKPDLVISSCGTVQKSGSIITVNNVVVKNIGAKTSTLTALGCYLSTNTTTDKFDYRIGYGYGIPSLSTNGTKTNSFTIDISNSTTQIPAGTYYVGFIADYQSLLSESNENNNTCYDSSQKFTVTFGCNDNNAHNYNPNATHADNTTCETCSDRIQNGDENKVDCGGAKCDPCENITITSSGAGSTFVHDDVIKIRWTDYITENVIIKMYGLSISGYYTVISSTASDGKYNYYIPSYIPDGQYRIKIESTTNSSINDYGDYFTIQSANLSCGNDANTLLFLPFDNNLNGVDGEIPLASSSVGYAGGKYDMALNVYSSATSLKYAANNNINSQKGTVEVWVKPTWNGNDGKGYTIMQYGTGGGLLILKDGANNLRLILNRFSVSGYPEMDVSTNISAWQAYQWKHIAFTWGNGKLQLYIDGSIVSERSYTTPLYPINDAHFNIGTDDGWFNWQGVIDNMRISNTVRSKNEINNFMNGCRGAKLAHPTIEIYNFPNPFDKQTTISYTLPEYSPVTLTVYDGMGKQVATLNEQETKQAGRHSIDFDASSYPTGIY